MESNEHHDLSNNQWIIDFPFFNLNLRSSVIAFAMRRKPVSIYDYMCWYVDKNYPPSAGGKRTDIKPKTLAAE